LYLSKHWFFLAELCLLIFFYYLFLFLVV
jgi:hypothetical protein